MLVSTLLDRLQEFVNHRTLVYEFDARYLQRWIREYPQVFPKFILENRYELIAIPNKDSWDYKINEL